MYSSQYRLKHLQNFWKCWSFKRNWLNKKDTILCMWHKFTVNANTPTWFNNFDFCKFEKFSFYHKVLKSPHQFFPNLSLTTGQWTRVCALTGDISWLYRAMTFLYKCWINFSWVSAVNKWNIFQQKKINIVSY